MIEESRGRRAWAEFLDRTADAKPYDELPSDEKSAMRKYLADDGGADWGGHDMLDRNWHESLPYGVPQEGAGGRKP